MFKITWEKTGAGWNGPKANGCGYPSSNSWVPFAERCNELEDLLRRCWELVPEGTDHGDCAAIKKALNYPPQRMDGWNE